MHAGSSGNGGWITACCSLFVLGCFVGATTERVMIARQKPFSVADSAIISGTGSLPDDRRMEPSFTAPEPAPPPEGAITGSGTVESVTGDLVKVHIADGDFTATLRLMAQTDGPRDLRIGDKIEFEGRISADRTYLEAVSITRLPPDTVLKSSTPPRPK